MIKALVLQVSESSHRDVYHYHYAFPMQVLSPFTLIAFPLCFSLIAVMLNVEGPCKRILVLTNKIELFQVPFSICYMLTSLHSPVHSILLLTLIRIYRNKLFEMFSKVSLNLAHGACENFDALLVFAYSLDLSDGPEPKAKLFWFTLNELIETCNRESLRVCSKKFDF